MPSISLEMVANSTNRDEKLTSICDVEDIPYIYLITWIYANEKIHAYVEIDEIIDMVDNNLNFVLKQIIM